MTASDNSPKPFILREAAGDGARLNAPAAERNQQPIIETLSRALNDAGLSGRQLLALEIASGTGQHVAAFAKAYPDIHWQPSDGDGQALASIAAWRNHAKTDNIAEPIHLDLLAPRWTQIIEAPLGLIFASNLLHISPWEVTQSFLAGAKALLAPDGIAFVYGCFSRDGDWVSDSNRAFDESLKSRDPRWGLRDTADVAAEAARHGLAVREIVAMPANNTVMIFAHQG